MAVWPLPRITFRGLSSLDEPRPVALLTTSAAWSALHSILTLPVVIQAEPPRSDRDLIEYLAAHLPSHVEAVYAVGDGAAVEAAKIVAAHNAKPLVIVPSALDGVAPFLPTARVDTEAEGQKRIEQIETGPAAEVVVDWEVIEAAPPARRAAGIVEVLSAASALLDWRHSAKQGQNPPAERFTPWAASVATDLARQAIKSAAALGEGQPEALQTLLDLLLLLVQLGNQLGHRRLHQGSEHFLADILAVKSDPSLTPAERLGPSLLFAYAVHGQNLTPLRDALQAAQIPLNRVRTTDFGLSLDNLKRHLDRFEFPYSVLNDLDPDSMEVIGALHASGLAVRAETWREPMVPSRSSVPAAEAPHDDKRLHVLSPSEPAVAEADQATRPAEDAADAAAIE